MASAETKTLCKALPGLARQLFYRARTSLKTLEADCDKAHNRLPAPRRQEIYALVGQLNAALDECAKAMEDDDSIDKADDDDGPADMVEKMSALVEKAEAFKNAIYGPVQPGPEVPK